MPIDRHDHVDHRMVAAQRLGARNGSAFETTGADSTPWFVWGIVGVATVVVLAFVGSSLI